MKKEYTTPVIEKIAFNYRDQVVAASGDPSQGGGGPNINWGDGIMTEDEAKVLFNYVWGICRYL